MSAEDRDPMDTPPEAVIAAVGNVLVRHRITFDLLVYMPGAHGPILLADVQRGQSMVRLTRALEQMRQDGTYQTDEVELP